MTTKAREKRSLAAIAAVMLAIFISFAFSAGKAWADTPNVGDTWDGSAKIGSSFTTGGESTFYGTELYGFAYDGSTFYADGLMCVDHGRALPDGHSGSFTATVTWVDTASQMVGYHVRIVPYDYSDGYQAVEGDVSVRRDLSGTLEMWKRSSDPSMTDDNPCYQMGHIEYGIWANPECTQGTNLSFFLDAEGRSAIPNVPTGDYWIREVESSVVGSGYLYDGTVKKVTVTAGQTTTVEFADQPDNDPFSIRKTDQRTGETEAEGGASFEGAVFRVAYYKGIYTADTLPSSPEREWYLKTGEDGVTSIVRAQDNPDKYLVSGDDFYLDEFGRATFPYGTVAVWEVSAPEGYHEATSWTVNGKTIESDPIVQTFEPGQELSDVSAFSDIYAIEAPITGGVAIEKRDAESNLTDGLGAATMDGTEFEIVNLSEGDVSVGGVKYATGEVCATIASQDGVAQTGSNALPYGSYSITEKSAGEGYNASDTATRYFNITEEGVIVAPTLQKPEGMEESPTFSAGSNDADDAHDTVRRGDLSFVKMAENTGHGMAGVVWAIQSVTTGERHIVVTDENGQFDSSAEWIAHSAKTNANDDAVTFASDGSYTIDESKLVQGAGVWFGLTSEGNITSAKDDVGAFPYDTYTLTELATSASSGYALVDTKFTIRVDGRTVDRGTIDNAVLDISTTATDVASGTHSIVADPSAQVSDRVAYQGLRQGETYKLKATIVSSDGVTKIASGERDFTVDGTDGHVVVRFDKVDLSGYAGQNVVVFEDLYYGDNKIASHEELDDADQTLSVISPKLSTTAIDARDGDKIIKLADGQSILDTVSYHNLVEGREYTLTGVVHVAARDSQGNITDLGPLTDSSGNEVTASKTFTAEMPTASQQMTFKVDASTLGGYSLVVFETLYRESIEIASHADITDESQTVDVPAQVWTTLVDSTTSNHTGISSETCKLVDTVAYSGLTPSVEYTVTGKLMDRDSGNALTHDGIGYVATKTFTPTESTGETEVTFELDSSDLAGRTIVAFETITLDGYEIGSHEDISDAAQSVKFARIGTTATDGEDGDHEAVADSTVKIVDTVAYKGFESGAEYTISGVIMDANTDKPIEVNGNKVTAERTFRAEEANGEVEVEFSFDGTGLAGYSLVVFETATQDGSLVASHEDIADKSQTVDMTSPAGSSTQSESNPVSRFFDKTGDWLASHWWVVLLALAAGSSGVILLMKRKDGKPKPRGRDWTISKR